MNHYIFFKRAIKHMSDDAIAELWHSLSANACHYTYGDDDLFNLSKEEIDHDIDQALDLLNVCFTELDKRNYFEID